MLYVFLFGDLRSLPVTGSGDPATTEAEGFRDEATADDLERPLRRRQGVCRSRVGGEQAMVEYWQAKRGGGKRGIIEIVEESND